MQWVFDGKNRIYNELISKLPKGKVYNIEDNVIPYIDEIVLMEIFPNYPPDTEVEIWINDKLDKKVKILSDHSIYATIKPIYGKFKIQLKINNKIHFEQYFYAVNIFVFLLCLAKTFNYDYVELFKLFGNLYFNTTQDNFIYKKWGWFFNFPQLKLDIEKYRQILGGSNVTLGVIQSFLFSILVYGLKKLIESFTLSIPTISIYRNYDGWIIRSVNYPKDIWNKRFVFYWLDNLKEIPSEDIMGKNKQIILYSKRFKLYTIKIIINNWNLPETLKIILNELIYKVVPAYLQVEIIYS